MRLIDLDQQIFVPIVDESQGGCRYELQMTVGEFFDRFLEGSFTPEVVDAIPVEWLNYQINRADEEHFIDVARAFRRVREVPVKGIEGDNVIVYCNQKMCVWNDDGQCSGPKQPAGHVALYISETLGGEAICTDMQYKDGWEDEQDD